MTDLTELQEGPEPLHPAVRRWEPRPFNAAEYERWAARQARRDWPRRWNRNPVTARMEPPPQFTVALDPGLFITPYLDDVERWRPWIRS